MKNILFEAFINDLVMLGEAGKKPVKKSTKKPAKQKDKKPASAKYTTGGRWYTADPTTGGEYVGKYEGPRWVDATPAEKAKEKQKPSGTKSRGKASVGKQGRGKSPAQPSISTPKIGSKFTDQKIYNELTKLLSSGDAQKLQQFVDRYGIQFNQDKKIFYVMKDSKNVKLSGDARKIFGEKDSSAIFNRLTSLGVKVPLAGSVNPLAPTSVVPRESVRPFEASVGEDGSVTFGGATYENVDDIDGFVKQKLAEWKKTPDGKKATPEQEKEFTIKLVAVAAAINNRNILLKKLALNKKTGKPENVAVFDTDESKQSFISSLEEKLLSSVSKSSVKKVKEKFKALREENDPDKCEQLLLDILNLAVDDESEVLRKGGVIPGLAENLSAILEMKRGRTVIIPMRDNFEASDVISLSPTATTDASPSELVSQIQNIYVGVSVKFGRGGASSLKEKTNQSIFYPDHKETVRVLSSFGSQISPTGNLFDTDPAKKKAREDEVRKDLETYREEVCKYYGFDPKEIDTVDKLVAALSNGEPECVDGKVTPKRKAQAPLGRPGIDVSAWRLTLTMQAAWSAVYNTRVVAQAFASQTWTTDGLVEVDGLSRQAKQIPQGLKQTRGSGMQLQPDYLVSFNKPVSSTEELRSGNPCK